MAKQENDATSEKSSASDARLFNIADLWRILRERWIWGFLAALLVSSAFVVYMMQKKPVYRASATLLVEDHPDKVVDIQRVVDQSLDPFSLQIELNNHLEQMRSSAFLKRVVQSLDEEEIEALERPYATLKPAPGAGQIVSENFHVELIYDTQVFKLSFDHYNPEVAALMTNRIAHEYVNFLAARSGVGNERALEFLTQQADSLRLKLEKAEQDLQEYRQSHNLISLEDNQSIMRERLQEIVSSLTKTDVELNSQLARLSQLNEAETPEEMLSLPFVAEYGEVSALQTALHEAERQREVLSQTYLPKHPAMLENESQQQSLRAKISDTIAMAKMELNNRVSELRRKKQNLSEQLSAAEKEALALEQRAINYNVLTRNRDTTKKTYTQILDRLNEARIASELKDSNLRLVDAAGVPQKPFTPNKRHVAAVGAFLFAFFFGTVPLGLNLMDRRLRNASDVSDYIGKELLGVVPRARRKEKQNLASPTNTRRDSPINESFRGIYSSLKLACNGQPKTLMVSSTLPSEGKSVIAAHIAAAFSRHDKRTLLIDCDFRRPCQHRFFGLDNDHGLLRWLNSDRPVPSNGEIFTDPDLGIERPNPRLFVCRAGGISDSPTELIQSERFLALLETFRKSFDVVVVDTAPLGLFPEAMLLADEMEQTLYVVEHNRISRSQIRKLLQRLDRTRTKIAGIVFNKVKGQHDDLLHGHNYGYNMAAGGKEYSRYYRNYYGRRVS